ncbi:MULTISPECIES: helix-turn-helix domain-containing protein [Shewanella]|jgi:DNA-binding CsgD family transcriptional regulator|uniref:helix-turn-helix domain-containing protein n=1 Tax=Shewanella TaxID=22 RepID=UPI00200C4286|nr:LuxR C-terminal-related transcriptional regulator [Shewanella basaltis]MCL1115321.1 LuxR C-terminal-related transcriptional regulator [Shewanella basaltis]
MLTKHLLILDFPLHLQAPFHHLANLIECNLIACNSSDAPAILSTIANIENSTAVLIHYLEHPLQEISYLPADLFKSHLHIAYCPALNVELEVILISSGFHSAMCIDTNLVDQIQSLNKVLDGDISFSDKALSKYILQKKRVPSSGNRAKILAVTTKKEQQILSLILHGLTNEEMAKELNISVNTVKMHVQNIYKKTKIKNRGQLFAYAAG